MGKQILVIDDEELLIKSFSRLLEKAGYDVYTVKNGVDAIVATQEEDFDLIISDVRMPGENGVQTIREIQNLRLDNGKAAIPTIFITGFADDEVEKEAKTLNPVAYLYKPFDTIHFLKMVSSAISK